MAVMVRSGNLTANVVSTINFSNYYPRIAILNRGSDDIWVRADSINPTVGGDDSFVIPSYSWKDNIINSSGTSTEIRLISASAISFTVEGITF